MLLPKKDQFVEVLRRDRKHMAHVCSARVRWADGVGSFGKRHPSTPQEIDNNFDLGVETMQVARLVIHGVDNESNTLDPDGAHLSLS